MLGKVADHNLSMNGEIRGVHINGQEVRGIESSGWGGMAKVEVDQKSKIVKKIAERQTSPLDDLFKGFYLQSIEKQLMESKEDKYINLLRGQNDDGQSLDI